MKPMNNRECKWLRENGTCGSPEMKWCNEWFWWVHIHATGDKDERFYTFCKDPQYKDRWGK